MIERKYSFFLDSGRQKFFVPLLKPENYDDPKYFPFPLPDSLKKAVDEVEEIEQNGCIDDKTKETLEEIFHGGIEKNPWQEIKTFLRMRFGKKTWHFRDGLKTTLNGIWFAFETNTSAQDKNRSDAYDRGYFYKKDILSGDEISMFINEDENKQPLTAGESQYISKEESAQGATYSFEIPNPNGGIIEFKELKFAYEIMQPNGDMCDVDVILDLGNTRTAGLLFNHDQGSNTFPPSGFRQFFKILRLKPDPFSGEYENLDDVDAGIASSWIVLHELDHQTYWPPNPTNQPPEITHLQKEYCGKGPGGRPEVIRGKSGFFGIGKQPTEVKGDVCLRVPQMFTQLSPVLMGDQAERCFNLPYAKTLISQGARVQQSSPKRYYWDNSAVTVYWNMLLNEWDPSYNERPTQGLPTIQGEMFRFIRENGEILDLSGNADKFEPAFQPCPYPAKPIYPRQSTLTWTLLHILERAYAQTNITFSSAAVFIPHRLSKVLITYPSGWTNDEVSRYRERCQEALNIFSQANIYSKLMEEKPSVKLELVPQTQTPDEAVAGQLPFIFSEIIRYPGQSAAGWISIAGKKRKDESGEYKNTVRIMNFDIGGGTTDISVIEYKDLNQNPYVNQNILSTTLLFKDGKALAGDDILKGIIEDIVLAGLIENSVPEIAEKIKWYFSVSNTQRADECTRSRIVRTCLIPLATKCLSASGVQTVDFSPENAGVNENNWMEFCEVLSGNPTAIPYQEPCVHFSAGDINAIVEKMFENLFHSCAIYAAAYDIDMLIFSGKPSELPVIKELARKSIPIDDGRIIFARDFKPGNWYPFTDKNGFIEDAKTVTVVGSALYYALSRNLIENWSIKEEKSEVEPNEWGQYKRNPFVAFLPKDQDQATIPIMPNFAIARRQNKCSSEEPVYKFVRKNKEIVDSEPIEVTFVRKIENNVESIAIQAIKGEAYDPQTSDYELILWPCDADATFDFWQETGKFDIGY